jgi:hypothetical protein
MKVVKRLLEKGADIDLVDSDGKTPLSMMDELNGTEMKGTFE